jgi:hypothetical protein
LSPLSNLCGKNLCVGKIPNTQAVISLERKIVSFENYFKNSAVFTKSSLGGDGLLMSSFASVGLSWHREADYIRIVHDSMSDLLLPVLIRVPVAYLPP